MSWPARIVLALSLVLAGFVLGTRLKQGEWDADKAKQQKAAQAAQIGASHDVAKAEAQSVKVITKIKTITRTVPVYRSIECQHDVRVFDSLNDQLRGSSDGILPGGSGGSAGSDDGRDNGQAD